MVGPPFIKPEEDTNTDVKPQEQIRPNPAEKSEPVVDNVDENGDIVPDLPPAQDSETEDQPIESDPSYDQPDQDVPEDNDINDKRDDETSDDEFFFD